MRCFSKSAGKRKLGADVDICVDREDSSGCSLEKGICDICWLSVAERSIDMLAKRRDQGAPKERPSQVPFLSQETNSAQTIRRTDIKSSPIASKKYDN